MTGQHEQRVLATGLRIGESPRWHDGRLWVSDMGAGEVVSVDSAGAVEVVTRVPGMPMGLGWLPDGTMLVVSSGDGRLLRRDGTRHADLSGLGAFPWSDMAVDGRGNAYIGNIGCEFGSDQVDAGFLVVVTPDGRARRVADDLQFPNGVAVTPDNRTLIVAETYAHHLTAFDIDPDGDLSNRRVWADLGRVDLGAGPAYPDGICLDADGAVWYADVPGQHCVRVAEGGTVLATVDVGLGCFACALGGADRRTLFIVAADWRDGAIMLSDERTGQVIAVDAPAAGVGWP
jgi:sugar lactone lactonase YvrE